MTDVVAAPPLPDAAERRHLDPSRELDRQVAGLLSAPAPWRSSAIIAVAIIPVLSLGLPLLVVLAGLPRHGAALGAYSLIGEAALGVVVLLVARRVAARAGGWQPALGLGRPDSSDVTPAIAWSGIQFGTKIAVGILLVALIPWMRDHHGGNLTGVDDLGPAGVVLLLIASVVVAPVVEEVAFRGVLLRALMRRISFWPAATVSALLFGALHAPTASAAMAIPAVVTWTSVFALLQCVLVRTRGRLAPAIGVHAVTNALAVALALAVSA